MWRQGVSKRYEERGKYSIIFHNERDPFSRNRENSNELWNHLFINCFLINMSQLPSVVRIGKNSFQSFSLKGSPLSIVHEECGGLTFIHLFFVIFYLRSQYYQAQRVMWGHTGRKGWVLWYQLSMSPDIGAICCPIHCPRYPPLYHHSSYLTFLHIVSYQRPPYYSSANRCAIPWTG